MFFSLFLLRVLSQQSIIATISVSKPMDFIKIIVGNIIEYFNVIIKKKLRSNCQGCYHGSFHNLRNWSHVSGKTFNNPATNVTPPTQRMGSHWSELYFRNEYCQIWSNIILMISIDSQAHYHDYILVIYNIKD